MKKTNSYGNRKGMLCFTDSIRKSLSVSILIAGSILSQDVLAEGSRN